MWEEGVGREGVGGCRPWGVLGGIRPHPAGRFPNFSPRTTAEQGSRAGALIGTRPQGSVITRFAKPNHVMQFLYIAFHNVEFFTSHFTM